MSLRGRLLLAVGAVALIALLTADVATYSSLKNFLYDRVDQSLDSVHVDGGGGGPGHGGDGRIAPGTFVEIREADDSVYQSFPAFRDGNQYTPDVPTHLQINGQLEYFTVDSVESGGPEFRVRASALNDGGQLLVATTLDDTTATLHRL